MFKNILCPLDLKPRSRMALKKAINIAHQFNSKIYLLHINEQFMPKEQMVMSRVSINQLGDEFKKIALAAKSDMKSLVNDLEAEDIDCEFILRDGKADDIIVKISNEMNIDLVVMGTIGKDSFSDIILGTTAQKVVEKSNCPVLIMPKGETE